VLRSVLLLLLALAPCAALLAWYLYAVRRAPEPAWRVVGCLLGGAAAFGAAAGLHLAVPALRDLSPAARAFGLVGPSEELLKLAVILLVGGWPWRYGRLVSGVVFAVAVATGFAAAENIVYVDRFDASAGAIRAMTAVPGHVLHSALIGVALGRWHAADRAESPLLLSGLALLGAIGLHGTYDLLLATPGPARFGVLVLLAAETAAVGWLFARARAEDLANDTRALASIGLLRDAPASSLRLLAERSVRRRLPAGRRLLRQGGPGDRLFLLLRGRLLVDRAVGDGREKLAELEAGAVVGELSLLTGDPRNADVEALRDSTVLRVGRPALLEAVHEAPELADDLVAAARPRVEDRFSLPDPEALRREARQAFEVDRAELRRGGLAHRLGVVPLLAALPAELLERLADDAVEVEQRPGATLVRQGRSSPGLCVLLEGEAEVRRNGRRVGVLVEGDVFGEGGLLTGWPATATVRALAPIRICALRWSDLQATVGLAPELGVALLDGFEERLHELRVLGAGVEPGRPAWTERLRGLLLQGGLLGRRRSADPLERALTEAFDELAWLPASTTRALATAVIQLDEPGVVPGSDGFFLGADQAFYLRDAELEEVLARSPDVLRFLARCRLASTASLVGRPLSPRTRTYMESIPKLLRMKLEDPADITQV
jgi:CRP-like cAMP-binding protein/RsiW-degrading membrane proteinase PrsW (M82 family)